MYIYHTQHIHTHTHTHNTDRIQKLIWTITDLHQAPKTCIAGGCRFFCRIVMCASWQGPHFLPGDFFCMEAFLERHGHGHRQQHTYLQIDRAGNLHRFGQLLSAEEDGSKIHESSEVMVKGFQTARIELRQNGVCHMKSYLYYLQSSAFSLWLTPPLLQFCRHLGFCDVHNLLEKVEHG